MPPPPSSNLASRLFLGPALRTQSDHRLVKLVRGGYENAFEEIVRRYGKSLVRYAAAIVPFHRADDVTQDAFSKALLALRNSDKEIELRPWLYRIVRNTALNDIRDAPPAAAALTENLDGVETPEEIAERRAEIADLLQRLRSLPEPQRAAIVMRELEGLSHEEIAAQLGMTGGAARQTIYRAREALRNGAGFLIPVPALHFLLASSAGGAAGAGLGSAAGGAAASAGGAGFGTGIKAGLATVLIGGTVATGVAVEEGLEDTGPEGKAAARESDRQKDGRGSGLPDSITAAGPASAAGGSLGDSSGPGGGGSDDRSGSNSGSGSGSSGSNSGPGSGSGAGTEDGGGHSGPGGGDSDSGSSGSGDSGSGSGSSGSGSSGSGSGSSGSNSGPGSGSDGSGSGSSGSGSDSDNSGSGSDSSGSGSGEPDFELDFD